MDDKDNVSLLLEHQRELREQLSQCEKLIYEKETEYLEATDYGNIVRGWDGYIDSKLRRDNAMKRAKTQDCDRIFSLSSVSSQVVDPEEQQVAREAAAAAAAGARKGATASGAGAASAAGVRERSKRDKRKRKRGYGDDQAEDDFLQ
eukprot:g6083.t1